MQKLINQLKENVLNSKLIELWNEFQSETGGDDLICHLAEWDEILGDKPYQFACRVIYGDVENAVEPVFLNGYGNFETFRQGHNDPIDYAALAEWLEENGRASEVFDDEYTGWEE